MKVGTAERRWDVGNFTWTGVIRSLEFKNGMSTVVRLHRKHPDVCSLILCGVVQSDGVFLLLLWAQTEIKRWSRNKTKGLYFRLWGWILVFYCSFSALYSCEVKTQSVHSQRDNSFIHNSNTDGPHVSFHVYQPADDKLNPHHFLSAAEPNKGRLTTTFCSV